MKTDFSKLAPCYDLLGTVAFCGSLRRSQNYFLGSFPDCPRVLIFGGGTGTFLIDLLQSVSVTEVDYVDISPGMINKAKQKYRASGSTVTVNFICGDYNDIPEKKYDLICCNYILDCFNDEELEKLMPHLLQCLNRDGDFLFSDFFEGGNRSFIKRGLIRFLYFFFRLICGLKVDRLADFEKHFQENNLIVMKERFFYCKLLRSVLFKKKPVSL